MASLAQGLVIPLIVIVFIVIPSWLSLGRRRFGVLGDGEEDDEEGREVWGFVDWRGWC